MSYQPQPPQGTPDVPGMPGIPQQYPGMPSTPPTQQMGYTPPMAPMPPAAPAPAAKGARRKGLLGLGSLLALAGIGGGVGLIVTASSTYESAVKGMARAPIGCTTTLDFAKAGEYVFYVETSGSTPDVGGDCDGNGDRYDRAADDLPKVDLTLQDPDDSEVDFNRRSDVSYDAGGFVGRAIRSATIDKAGTYKLLVSSDDKNFAIAVGKTPKQDADDQKSMGIGLAAIGAVLGGLLILLGLRRKKLPPAAPMTAAPAWGQQPQQTWQQAPGQPPAAWPGQSMPAQPVPGQSMPAQPVPAQPVQPSWPPQQPMQPPLMPPQQPAQQQPMPPQQPAPPANPGQQMPPPPPGWGTPSQ